ncbi:histidine kinase [Flavobacterium amniphilum]|uniref:sensor histidine kinase n=1 Tax=Flavobacterium amniphilum TaxID=1834035 RepID=UPI002029C72E|nr:ATP-binding protein [Flavobacterium amniphilum]MCL9807194.1 histidine kinase [Flavobacterium amniphilum]
MDSNAAIQQNELISAIIYTFSAFLLLALLLVLFFYFSRKKIIQKEIEKKNMEVNYQKELLHSIIVTQEEERKRIAQDLHDDISSKLNIVSLNSHLLTASNLSEIQIAEISANIINLTTKALDNSRRIAHDLLPPVLEKFGLHAGVEELCFEINSSKSIEIEYKNSVEFDNNEIHKHLHVFRIIQELFNNSLKHGKSSKISLSFEQKNGFVYCKFSDNGIGFDVENFENQKGLGMKNIESRVSFLKGALHVDSELNKGTQVIFNF